MKKLFRNPNMQEAVTCGIVLIIIVGISALGWLAGQHWGMSNVIFGY